MRYAIKIGPLPIEKSRSHAYVAYNEGRMEAAVERSDDEGLAMLLRKCGHQNLACEPALAKAAIAYGLKVADLPPEVAEFKAALAVTFDHGPALLKVGPDLILELIDASEAFDTAAPWNLLASNDPLSIRIEATGREYEGCVLGAGGEEFGLALYHQPGSVARMERLITEEGPAAARSLSCTTMLLAEDRPCAVDAVRAFNGADVAPLVLHIARGVPCPAGAKDVAVLVAALRAVTALVEGRPPRGETRTPGHRVVAHAASAGFAAEPYEPEVLYEGVGRNEPCPCGSGKKFKRCHLEAIEAAQSRARYPGSAPAPLSQRASLHQRDERLAAEIIHYGVRRFGDETLERRVGESLGDGLRVQELTTPWVAYMLPFEGEPLAAHFLRSRGQSLPAQDRQWIELQLTTPLGVWEILRADPGHGAEVVDLLTGARLFIHEVLASGMLASRDAILGRVVTDGISVLCGVHGSPLPPMSADDVVTQFGAAAPGDFEATQRLFDLWQSQVAELGRKANTPAKVTNTDGHEAAKIEDRFALRSGSFDAVFARLTKLDGVNIDEHDRKGARFTFTRPGNAKHPKWENTIIGSARLTTTRLVVETNSTERAEQLTTQLRAVLGDLATWKKRTREELPQAFGSETMMIDGQVLTSPRETTLQDAYRAWLDTPVASLGERTLRQAVSDDEGRRAVHLLLKQQENLFARKPSTGFDPAQLRRELGLDELGQPRPNGTLDRAMGSGRKISETLLDFAQPLIDAEGAQANERHLRSALRFAIDVWNASVLASQTGIPLDAAMLSADFAGTPELERVERLIARKRERFADDLRIVGNWQVKRSGDRFDVQMEARVTDALRAQLEAAGVPMPTPSAGLRPR